MKSKTYKITLVIEAAIAVLIAFCLAFFGPLSLNDMTYGEFDMQVFKLCFTYPAIIIFIALFVVLAVISYKKEHTKKRYIAEIVLFAVLLIFVYFLGVFVPRTFRYEGVVMNAAEYTDIMHELKPSKCFEGENTDYIEKIGENLSDESWSVYGMRYTEVRKYDWSMADTGYQDLCSDYELIYYSGIPKFISGEVDCVAKMQDSLRVKVIDNSHIKGDNATNIGIYTNGTYENIKYSMYTKDYNGQKAIVIYADEGDKHIFLTLQLLDKSAELSLADENTLLQHIYNVFEKEN